MCMPTKCKCAGQLQGSCGRDTGWGCCTLLGISSVRCVTMLLCAFFAVCSCGSKPLHCRKQQLPVRAFRTSCGTSLTWQSSSARMCRRRWMHRRSRAMRHCPSYSRPSRSCSSSWLLPHTSMHRSCNTTGKAAPRLTLRVILPSL